MMHGISYLNAPGHTGTTWNPVVGCERVSEGCANCWAEAYAHREMCEQHRGLTEVVPTGACFTCNHRCDELCGEEHYTERAVWTGEVRLLPKALAKPLSWRKPRMVLAPSMGDLFHEDVPGSFVYAAIGIMMAAHRSTFLVPTKRINEALTALRLAEGGEPWGDREHHDPAIACLADAAGYVFGDRSAWLRLKAPQAWPPKNIVIFPSVENQRRADGRLPVLAELAAMGWRTGVSVEPQLGPVDVRKAFTHLVGRHDGGKRHYKHEEDVSSIGGRWVWGAEFVAVGAETGPGARPCKTEWVRDVVDQCRAVGVRCHVKQLAKGEPWDPSEWPRQFVDATRVGGAS